MARWNPAKKVLDHEHTRFWQYDLKNISEPNLQRDVFPYEEVCRIDFDHKFIPIDPADELWITDTTFRDGQQARPPYSVEQILQIFDFLSRLSGPRGVIRQTEFFLYSDRDKEAVRRCQERDVPYPEITGWIRAHPRDLELVQEMGLKETGILTSVSDYHIFYKLNLDRPKALDQYLEIVHRALELGITPRCHFEDITRADIYGFCIPFAIELMKLRESSGIDIKVRLCDTMGYGVTYPGTALPRSVPRLVRAMIEDAGVPGSLLEWHGHNDFHKGFINATTAWLYGCAAINGALLGFGERTGNTPIEGLLIEYISLLGRNNGINTRVITEMADFFEKEIHFQIPPNYPFVGSDFNATSAGIHADGLIKNEEIYNIFNTDKILGRPISIIITDKSGTAGIVHWLNKHLNLTGPKMISKNHPGVHKIYKWVMRQYEEGRVTSLSSQEMMRVSRKYLPEYFLSEFDALKQKAYQLAYHIVEEILEQEAVRSMNPVQQEPVMENFIELNPFIQFIYVINLDGKKITKNITRIVDRSKYQVIKLDEDFSGRSWFTQPIKDGKIFISDFYTSRITGALCITVSGPVRNPEEDIVGILGIDLKFEDLVKMEQEGEI
jgi:isopropylmalate/homocitrate/citramalate synthase